MWETHPNKSKTTLLYDEIDFFSFKIILNREKKRVKSKYTREKKKHKFLSHSLKCAGSNSSRVYFITHTHTRVSFVNVHTSGYMQMVLLTLSLFLFRE